MKHAVEKEKLDCDFVLTRSFEVFLDTGRAEKANELFERHMEEGLNCFRDVHFVHEKYAERLTYIKGAKGALSTTAASLWPYKFVSGLLATTLSRGLNLQSHTPVTSISLSESGSDTTVTTPRGSVRARKVIFASNAYTAGMLPQYSQKIVPVKVTCSHIVAPADPKFTPPPHLSNTYGISYGPPGIRDYLIPRPDGSIIVGGGKDTYTHDRSLWYGVYDDSTLIEPAKDYFDGLMQRHFRGWENSGAYTDMVWTGIIGSTPDSLPHVGNVPGTSNQFILAGFNGAGMTTIFLCAKGVAKMVREGVTFEQSGVPKIFKTTEERLGNMKN